MSTSVAIPTSTPRPAPRPAPEISDALWRYYRRARAAHPERARNFAAGVALDQASVSDDRERLGRALENREAQFGLAASRHEREEDEAADAAQAASTPVRRPLAELEAAWREHQARAAIGDKDAIEAIKEIEAEMRTAKAEQDWQAEEAEQAAEAEREAQKQAAAQAQAMEPGIAKRRGDVDRLLAAAAIETAALRDEQQQHAAFLAASGVDRAPGFRARQVEDAITYHFRRVGLLVGGGRTTPLVPETEGQ